MATPGGTTVDATQCVEVIGDDQWGEACERDYWDVELSGGGLYRIFREGTSGDWFADGMYD